MTSPLTFDRMQLGQMMSTIEEMNEGTRVALGIFSRSLALQQAHFESEMNKLLCEEERGAILPVNPTSSVARTNAAQRMYESGRDFLESVLPTAPQLRVPKVALLNEMYVVAYDAAVIWSEFSSPPPPPSSSSSSSSTMIEGGVRVFPAGAKRELSEAFEAHYNGRAAAAGSLSSSPPPPPPSISDSAGQGTVISQGMSVDIDRFCSDQKSGVYQEGRQVVNFAVRRKQAPRGSVSSAKTFVATLTSIMSIYALFALLAF